MTKKNAQAKKKAAKRNAPLPHLDDVIFGYDNDGSPIFYYPAEGDAARDGEYLERRYADCADLARVPLLGLIRGGSGLWYDRPSEWADAGASPNGWVAYTTSGARALIDRARPGDSLVPLGAMRPADWLSVRDIKA